MVLFYQRANEPWYVEIEGNKNDRKTVSGTEVETSTVTASAVDRNVQHDARRAVWNGEGPGRLSVAADERKDLTSYLATDSALIFDLKVGEPPSETTNLRMGCGAYCAADIDVTERLQELSGQGWETVAVDLDCFPQSGAKFGITAQPEEYFATIKEPFSLITDGTMDVTLANVRLKKGAGAEANLSCD